MKTKFSRIIAGTMNWGIWGKNHNLEAMSKLISQCVENGITSFDHADIYGDYTTEAEFGNAFQHSTIPRENVQFISKCGICHKNESRNNRLSHYDYSKAYIIACAEDSLQKLHTDYLDVLLLHRPSPLMQADEIAEAITQLQKEGKIRDFGVSNFTPSQTDLIQSRIKVECNQIEFSVTHFEAMLDGSLNHMQINDITPMAWSPLGSVFKIENQQTDRLKNLLMELMLKYDASLDVLLFAWIMKHPAGILPVTGTTTGERIANLTRAIDFELETQDWFALWVASEGKNVP